MFVSRSAPSNRSLICYSRTDLSYHHSLRPEFQHHLLPVLLTSRLLLALYWCHNIFTLNAAESCSCESGEMLHKLLTMHDTPQVKGTIAMSLNVSRKVNNVDQMVLRTLRM